MKFSIFLPASATYDSGTKVPVLWVLSGRTCDDQTFLHMAGAERLAAEKNIALVIPDTCPRNIDSAGYYVNATTPGWRPHYQMYDYVATELPELIHQAFPQLDRNHSSIMGHSMGGHGALVLFLRNPKRYVSVSAFAPICNPSVSLKSIFEAYLGDDNSAWESYDASVLVSMYNAKKINLLVDQGSADTMLGLLNPKALEEAAKGNKNVDLNLTYHEKYDHGYFFVKSFMEKHINYHATNLKRAIIVGQRWKKVMLLTKVSTKIIQAKKWIFFWPRSD